MILTCPECASRYQVEDASIPPQGRTVRCASCGVAWRAEAAKPEESPLDLNAAEPEDVSDADPAKPAAATLPKKIRAKHEARRRTREAAVAGAVWGVLAATLVAVIGAYFAADGLQASGFMAVFVFGIVLGNKEIFGFRVGSDEAQKLDEFVFTTAFIMRLFIFILLGAQVDFHLIGQYWLGGVAVVTVLMLVARPVTVFLCAWPDARAQWSFEEMLFMCWTRETGVIPAALAGLLLGLKAPGAKIIASVTFIAVLMTILIQAPTTKWLGAKLGLLDAANRRTI